MLGWGIGIRVPVWSKPPGTADSVGGGDPAVTALSSWISGLGSSSPGFLTSLLGAHHGGG